MWHTSVCHAATTWPLGLKETARESEVALQDPNLGIQHACLIIAIDAKCLNTNDSDDKSE